MSTETSQPEINIGMVGHVDHGKTTLTEQLSGKWTDTNSEELKRGITIRLGYANATFYACKKCKEGERFKIEPKCKEHGEIEDKRIISLVDAPGHETLMATMLSGAAIMDAALLLIAANEKCPQPQTKEHLMALEITGIKNILIVQNKIDLVSKDKAKENYKEIMEFIKNTIAKDAKVIPISAQHGINIDGLIQAIEELFPTPKRDRKKEPRMFVARSFDTNRPGTPIEKLVGGVLGGSLKQGALKEKDNIEIRPGRKKEKEGKVIYEPIITEITEIRTADQKIKDAIPGGSIAIATKLDPSTVKSDALTGSVVGLKGKLPPTWWDLTLEPHLLDRVVGAKDELIVEPIKKGETLMLNVNAAATVGTVNEITKGKFHIKLKIPVCADKTDRITLSRLLGARFRLIGWGTIKEK